MSCALSPWSNVMLMISSLPMAAYKSATGTIQFIRNGSATINGGCIFLVPKNVVIQKESANFTLTVQPSSENAVAITHSAPMGFDVIGAILTGVNTASGNPGIINADTSGAIVQAFNPNPTDPLTITGNVTFIYAK